MPTLSDDFFISYHRADLYWAEWIAEQLEEAKYQVVLEAWNFHAGENLVLDLQQALTGTKQTLALFSDEYLQEVSVQQQWAATFQRYLLGERRPLIPIRVRPCELTGLLGPLITIDLFGQEENNARQLLLEGVSSEKRPRKATRFPGKPSQASQTPVGPSSSLSSGSVVFPQDLPPVTQTIDLFAVYASADQKIWNELEKHFMLLKRRGVINTWHAGQISPGMHIAHEIESYLNAAQIILFLVSSDLFADAFPLIEQAMLRQATDAISVIPVIVRPVDWEESPLGQLQPLPSNGVPAMSWQSLDEAFTGITRDIRQMLDGMLRRTK